MNIGGVREALHRQPFRPFIIRLADGRSFPVPHRDFVALGNRLIVVVGEDDSTSLIEPLLITSIDTPPEKGNGGNGKTKKRRRDS